MNSAARLIQISVSVSVLLTLIPSTFVQAQNMISPPVAAKKPMPLEKHGQVRIDEYYWLRERESQEVLDYLNAENAYTEQELAPTEKLQQDLFEQTCARIKETDVSAPVPDRGYEYYRRTLEGKQYPIYCRKKMESGAEEEILLDVNQLADGHEYCAVRSLSVSPNNKIMAYSVDFVGRRKYSMRVKNLETGQMMPDQVEKITGNLVWAEDNKTLFYTRQDPQTLRSNQVFRHELGSPESDDSLVFQEDDEEFSCYVRKSRSKKFILISSEQTVSSEFYFIDATQPHNQPTSICKRERDHEYFVDHHNGYFYFLTNWDAKNFRVMKASDSGFSKDQWKEVVAHSPDALLESIELFDSFLAIESREAGLCQIQIVPNNAPSERFALDFGEPCYVASMSVTPQTDTDWLRYSFSSLKTPPSTIEYNVKTQEKRIIKEREVLGGFNKDDYVSQRLWAPARDGKKVPVSIVYHKSTPLDGTAPCLQYAYGSYGYSIDPGFNTTTFNLLDRGFIYVIAHIRGGQEMGREWYDDGKLLNKKNTFTDFIDVSDFLIKEGLVDSERLYARGGSAGGLLMGAVMNMRPELYDGVIADVPFVDVITTMLDDSIPLTTGEYDEWGNPNDLKYYNYMLSYSPYDNVQETSYPNVLVTTGLHDSQVQYWEPAKWVARLRDRKTDQNMLLLKTNMEAGHGGASGRYSRYRETSLRQAFLIHLAERHDDNQ